MSSFCDWKSRFSYFFFVEKWKLIFNDLNEDILEIKSQECLYTKNHSIRIYIPLFLFLLLLYYCST